MPLDYEPSNWLDKRLNKPRWESRESVIEKCKRKILEFFKGKDVDEKNNIDQLKQNTKKEYDISEQQKKEREAWYAKKIEESSEWKEVIITMDNVVAGLKFIAEHPKMEQNQLIDELIALGCNFSFEDINKQFPEEVLQFPGMKDGHLGCGASVIANCMRSEDGRLYAKDRFLSVDDEYSVYAFIRKVTGDNFYTKEYVDSLINEKSSN